MGIRWANNTTTNKSIRFPTELYPKNVEGNVLSLIANKANKGQLPTSATTVFSDMSKIRNSISYTNLVSNGNFALDSNSDGLADNFSVRGTLATKSVANNIQTFKPSAHASGIITSQTVTNGHKICTLVTVKSQSGDVRVGNSTGAESATIVTMDGTWKRIVNIQTIAVGTTSSPYVDTNLVSGWVDIEVKEFMSFSLTALGLAHLSTAQCDEIFAFTATTATTSIANDCTLNNLAGSAASGFNSEVNTNSGKTVSFLRLDGSDDYGAFANTTSLDITTNELCISETFRIATGETTSWIINKTEDADNETQYGLKYNSTNNNIELWLKGDVRATTNASSITQNVWYNVIFYRNSSGNIVVHLNKVAQTGADYVGVLTSRANLRLGARASNAGGTTHTDYLKGDIATQSIYQATKLDIVKIIKAEMNISRAYTGVS